MSQDNAVAPGSTKIREQNAGNISSPKDFKPIHAWYLRIDKVGDSEHSPKIDKDNIRGDSEQYDRIEEGPDLDFQSEDNYDRCSPYQSPDPQTAKGRRQYYPLGVTHHVVGTRGRLPKCEGCRQEIQRGKARLVVKQVVDIDKGYTSTVSYHCLESCIVDLPWDLQAQSQDYLL